MKDKKPWQLLESERLIETPVFDVRRDRKKRDDPPKTMDFFIIDSVDWVNVIPITPQEEVILIEQHRQGIDEVSLEIPGGMIDPEDSSPTAAAKRELHEETGYQAASLLPLGVVHPNPAIQGNRCYTFLAPDVYLAGEPDPDEGEDITVVKFALAEIPSLLRKGRITHSLVVAAFHWFYLHQTVPADRPLGQM